MKVLSIKPLRRRAGRLQVPGSDIVVFIVFVLFAPAACRTSFLESSFRFTDLSQHKSSTGVHINILFESHRRCNLRFCQQQFHRPRILVYRGKVNPDVLEGVSSLPLSAITPPPIHSCNPQPWFLVAGASSLAQSTPVDHINSTQWAFAYQRLSSILPLFSRSFSQTLEHCIPFRKPRSQFTATNFGHHHRSFSPLPVIAVLPVTHPSDAVAPFRFLELGNTQLSRKLPPAQSDC